jgi:hypothetical protein
MNKLIFLVSLIVTGYCSLAQKRTDFSFTGGFQTSMFQNGRFQTLLKNSELKKVGLGLSFGARLTTKYLHTDLNMALETYNAGNSAFQKSNQPIKQRSIEGTLGFNLLPNVKAIKLYSGVSYTYAAIGVLIKQDSDSEEVNIITPYENSVAFSFPSLKMGLSSNRKKLLNVFVEGQHPLRSGQSFSSVRVGILLY